jgi:hypothetical protein
MPRLGELLTHTRALGARHVGYGVRAADYQTVGDALFAAHAAVLGDGFDAQTREAWMLAYNIVAGTMLEGAAAARPTGSSPIAGSRESRLCNHFPQIQVSNPADVGQFLPCQAVAVVPCAPRV